MIPLIPENNDAAVEAPLIPINQEIDDAEIQAPMLANEARQAADVMRQIVPGEEMQQNPLAENAQLQEASPNQAQNSELESMQQQEMP